jgi:argininosuccinate lyase
MLRFLVTLMVVSVATVGTAESAETKSSGEAIVKAGPTKGASAEMGPEEYWGAHWHRRHAPGVPGAPEWRYYERRLKSELEEVFNYLPSRAQMDRAWTVMLLKQGLISKDTAVKLLTALEGADQEKGYGGEYWLKKKLGGDEDTASAVDLGRTLQEPMSRLMLRRKLMHVLELMLRSLEVTLDVADANTETIMAGQTHLSHAQPTTYAAYLLSVHDGLARGLEQLELAYKHTNENSAGCGALAGTGWPVDRRMITELLGFDSLVEPAYDCEGGQDHPLTILFALTNVTILLSRTAMDHNIWSMEEIQMVRVSPAWCGVSSMMPQKAIPGSQLERIRIEACNVIGETITGVVACKGEPHGDMLPIYEGYRGALRAMCHAEKALGFYSSMLPAIEPDRERMLHFAREGFSAAPDLAVKLIRDKGYGGRRAHRICATFVRIARERGIKPYETSGELLDEAARIADEDPPGLSTEDVRKLLDPVEFIKRHNNLGDPAPEESRRMIGLRQEALVETKRRHAQRQARIDEAAKKLAAEVAAIVGDVSP